LSSRLKRRISKLRLSKNGRSYVSNIKLIYQEIFNFLTQRYYTTSKKKASGAAAASSSSSSVDFLWRLTPKFCEVLAAFFTPMKYLNATRTSNLAPQKHGEGTLQGHVVQREAIPGSLLRDM